MAYGFFENNVPVSSDTGSTVVADVEKNLQALRDMAAMLGNLPDWEYSITVGTGSTTKPQYRHYIYKDDTDIQIRQQDVWGTVGASERVTSVVYQYTENGGTGWDLIGVKTITYTSGIPTASDWS